MTTSGEDDLPTNVRLAIEDCGYKSIWAEFAYHMRFAYGLPAYPILNICEVIAKLRYGFSFHKYAAIEQVKKTKIPMLFIHGDQDDFVPYDMMEPLYEASAAPHKKKLTVPGAKHAEAYRIDPELYWREVEAWIADYL